MCCHRHGPRDSHAPVLPALRPGDRPAGPALQGPVPPGPLVSTGSWKQPRRQLQEERGQVFTPQLLRLSHGWQWLLFSLAAPDPWGGSSLQAAALSGVWEPLPPLPLQDEDGQSSPGAPPSPAGFLYPAHTLVIAPPLNSSITSFVSLPC